MMIQQQQQQDNDGSNNYNDNWGIVDNNNGNTEDIRRGGGGTATSSFSSTPPSSWSSFERNIPNPTSFRRWGSLSPSSSSNIIFGEKYTTPNNFRRGFETCGYNCHDDGGERVDFFDKDAEYYDDDSEWRQTSSSSPPNYKNYENQGGEEWQKKQRGEKTIIEVPPRSKLNTGTSDSSSRNTNNKPSFANGGIQRMINKLFEPYSSSSAFGKKNDKMMNRVDSELTKYLEEEKNGLKSILADARTCIFADPDVRNMLGSDLELGMPISKTSSSTMVNNGMTRSRLQLVIPVSGATERTGRIRIVANQDGITQLECDVEGRVIKIPYD